MQRRRRDLHFGRVRAHAHDFARASLADDDAASAGTHACARAGAYTGAHPCTDAYADPSPDGVPDAVRRRPRLRDPVGAWVRGLEGLGEQRPAPVRDGPQAFWTAAQTRAARAAERALTRSWGRIGLGG